MNSCMNDLNIIENNISLCEPRVSFTNKNNLEPICSPNILTESHCQGQKSNLSESQILTSQGQMKKSQDSQEKAWSSYSASYNSVLCSHSTSRPKEAKYKFPAADPPALDGLLQYSPKELYIYLINLIYHRLSPDTYKLWCELTERDVCFPEISKNGVLESSYSLKHQRDQFKKTKKKTAIAAE